MPSFASEYLPIFPHRLDAMSMVMVSGRGPAQLLYNSCNRKVVIYYIMRNLQIAFLQPQLFQFRSETVNFRG